MRDSHWKKYLKLYARLLIVPSDESKIGDSKNHELTSIEGQPL